MKPTPAVAVHPIPLQRTPLAKTTSTAAPNLIPLRLDLNGCVSNYLIGFYYS